MGITLRHLGHVSNLGIFGPGATKIKNTVSEPQLASKIENVLSLVSKTADGS